MNEVLQMCGLRELARLAMVGDVIASQLLTPDILSRLLVRLLLAPCQPLHSEALQTCDF